MAMKKTKRVSPELAEARKRFRASKALIRAVQKIAVIVMCAAQSDYRAMTKLEMQEKANG